MAVFRALRSLIRNPNPRSRSPFSSPSSPHPFSAFSPSSPSSPALAVSPNPFSFVLRLTSSHPALLSPLSKWVPFSGPLFLSAPPWKLSQSSTPLFLPGKGAIFPKELLQGSRFPIRLGFGAVGEVGGGVGGVIRWPHAPGLVREATKVGADERFLNLPNLISISRMVSGPFLGWMILNEWYLPAFAGLAISGATDWLDGFLARKMGINSVFGSYLDPLADKVLIGCVALAMVEKDLLHSGLVGIVVLRDIALVSGAVHRRASSLGWKWKSWSDFFDLDATHQEKVEPLLISKVNTVFQLILVAAALLQPDLGTDETQLYVTYLSWLVASTTIASSVAYGAQHVRYMSASATG